MQGDWILMKLLGHNVLVQKDKIQNDDGLVRPDLVNEDVWKGKVVEAGSGTIAPDGTPIPLTVVKSDRVMWPYGTGVEVVRDGKACVLLKEDDLLGVIG